MRGTAADWCINPALIAAIRPMRIFNIAQNAEENFDINLIQYLYDFFFLVAFPAPEILSLYPVQDTP